MMKNKDIRRQNLECLIQSAGGQKQLGAATDINPSMFSQIRNRTRGMGDSLARRIETALHKPPGWMDLIHPAGECDTAETPSPNPNPTAEDLRAADLARRIQKLPPSQQLLVEALLNELTDKT